MKLSTSTRLRTRQNDSSVTRRCCNVKLSSITRLPSIIVAMFLLFSTNVISPTYAFVAQNSGYHSSMSPRASSLKPTKPMYMSSVGGGDSQENSGKGDSDNPLNEWIQRKESENLRKYREQNIAEGRLPISFGAMNMDNTNNENEVVSAESASTSKGRYGPLGGDTQALDNATDATQSSSLARSKQPNPYLNVVSRLTPSDLIARFTATASPRVQDAVRTTILGLIGGLPQMAFETKTIATGERLASLMMQLQLTGYMFKNAEYRLSLSQSLGSNSLLLGGDTDKEWREGKRVKGKIRVRYGGDMNSTNSSSSTAAITQDTETAVSSPGFEVEVDAQSYMSELRTQVSRLREELDASKQAREEEIRKDLLLYIRTLPEKELKELTGTMSPEVLEAMKGLVTAVLAGISDDGDAGTSVPGVSGNKIMPDTVTEQSGEALAQLCMWQLVVGFNLRELEVREEFRASMKSLGEGKSEDGDDNSSIGSSGGDWE